MKCCVLLWLLLVLAVPTPLASSILSTLAGNGTAGRADGTLKHSLFSHPIGVALDPQNSNLIYVADSGNGCIRVVNQQDSTVSTLSVQGASPFRSPFSIDFDPLHPDKLYVADFVNNWIVVVVVDKSQRLANVTTIIGSGVAGYVNGNGTASRFHGPYSVAVDMRTNSTLYVADSFNNCIRRIVIKGMSIQVTTLAGSGADGYLDGNSSQAMFRNPTGVAVDLHLAGRLYVADSSNARIRIIDINGSSVNVATLFVDGNATKPAFQYPRCVAVDPHTKDMLYVSDVFNNRICMLIVNGSSIAVSGIGGNGTMGFADGGLSVAMLSMPYGVAVDRRRSAAGTTLYVADYGNSRIRQLVRTNPMLHTTTPTSTLTADVTCSPLLMKKTMSSGLTASTTFQHAVPGVPPFSALSSAEDALLTVGISSAALLSALSPESTAVALFLESMCQQHNGNRQHSFTQYLLSPFIAYGDVAGALGNIALTMTMSAVHWIAASGASSRGRISFEWRLQVSTRDLFLNPRLRFPALSFRLTMFLAGGTVLCAARMASSTGNVAVTISGIVILVVFLPAVVFLLATLSLSMRSFSHHLHFSRCNRTSGWLRHIYPRGRWSPPEVNRSMGPLFGAFVPSFIFSKDVRWVLSHFGVCHSVITSLIVGTTHSPGGVVCQIQCVALGCMSAVVGVLLLLLQPHRCPLTHWLTGTMYCAQAALWLALLVGSTHAQAVLLAAVSVLTLLKSAYVMWVWLYERCSDKRGAQVLKRRDDDVPLSMLCSVLPQCPDEGAEVVSPTPHENPLELLAEEERRRRLRNRCETIERKTTSPKRKHLPTDSRIIDVWRNLAQECHDVVGTDEMKARRLELLIEIACAR